MKIQQVNNLSNEDYHNSLEYKDYWSSSNLKEYLTTPKEAYFQKFEAEKKESAAMDFGSAAHAFFESKHVTGKKFSYNIFEPPINPGTGKAYGKDSDKYKTALSLITNPISIEDYENIKSIWRMAINSDYRWFFEKEILSQGIAEPSFFVNVGIHKYKYRPDVLTDTHFFDYKFLSKENFYGDLDFLVRKYKYDISGAFYQYFEHLRTGIWKPFYLILIMKEKPYDILIKDISAHCFEVVNDVILINSGARIFQQLKDLHELCQVTNNWPGLANKYPIINGIRLNDTSPRFERSFGEFEIN